MPMTMREILDDSALASARGEFPGWDAERRVCCYLAPDGRRCAVGRLIPPAKFVMDANRADGLAAALDLCHVQAAELVSDAPDAFDFVHDLQAAHDTVVLQRDEAPTWSHEAYMLRLGRVADIHGVKDWTPPALTQ